MRHLRELPFSDYVKDAFQKTRHVRMPVNDIGTIFPDSQRAEFIPGRNTWFTSPVVGNYELLDLTGPFSGFRVPIRGWSGITNNMVFFKLLELYGFTYEIGKIALNDSLLQSTDTKLVIRPNGFFTGTIPIKFTNWVENPTFQDFLDSCSLFLPVVDWMDNPADRYASVAYRLTGTDKQILDALSDIVSFYGIYGLKPASGIGTQWDELEDILRNHRDTITIKRNIPAGRGRSTITLSFDMSSRPSYLPYNVTYHVYRYPLRMTQFFNAAYQAMIGGNVRLPTVDAGLTLFELLSTFTGATNATITDVGHWYPEIVSLFDDYSEATGKRDSNNISGDIPFWGQVVNKRCGTKAELACGLPVMPVTGTFTDSDQLPWLMVGNSIDNLSDAWMFGVGYTTNMLPLGDVLTPDGKLPTDIKEVTKNVDMQVAGNIAILAIVLQGWGILTPNDLIYENLGSYWKITSPNQQSVNVFLTATKK